MEGTTRYNARRREEAKQQVGAGGDDSARAATSVPHFRPWVWRERNRLASQAGLPQPYPKVGTTRPTDNGERFFMEYAFEQATRRRDHGGKIMPAAVLAAGGCPCFECKDARRVGAGGGGGGGGGGASSSSTGGATSLTPAPTRVFGRGRQPGAAAAAAAAPGAVGGGASSSSTGGATSLTPAPTRVFGRGRPGAAAAAAAAPGAVAAEAPPTPAAAAPPHALAAAAAPLVWQPQAHPAAPSRGRGRGGRGPAAAPGRGQEAAPLLAPRLPLAPAAQSLFVGGGLLTQPLPALYYQALMQQHVQLHQPAQAPVAPRASKKSRREPDCTCGALVRTQQQRAAQGRSGPGGFTAQHTEECAWKQHFSGSGGGGEAGAGAGGGRA